MDSNNNFVMQELESRFEMEIITLPDGTVIDSGDYDLTDGSCECTSTCSPF